MTDIHIRTIGFCSVNKICTNCRRRQTGNLYNTEEHCIFCTGTVIEEEKYNLLSSVLKDYID